METAESKLLKATEASESFIKSLIEMPFGEDRSVIIRNLLLSFLGTTPMGDVRKPGTLAAVGPGALIFHFYHDGTL